MYRFVALCMLAALLTACGASARSPQISRPLVLEEERRQRLAALEFAMRQANQLQDVAYPILSNNVDLCDDRITYRIGVHSQVTANFDSEYREAAVNTFGVSAYYPTVISVTRGAPAEKAGIMLGDQIVRLNGALIGTGESAVEDLPDMVMESEGEEISFLVRRSGENGVEEHTILVKPEPQCDYAIIISDDDEVNAFADGNNVILTTGMLRFVENDNELALIVGHELAHNARGHISAQTTNTLLGRLIGASLGALAGPAYIGTMANIGGGTARAIFSEEFEAEADYVGVYYAARAGFDIGDAASIWRRMGIQNPASIDLQGASHPSTAVRFLAIEETAKEIQAKLENFQPLIPEEE